MSDIILLMALAKHQHISVALSLKDGAHTFCASRDTRLWVVLTNSGIFLGGLKLCGESRN